MSGFCPATLLEKGRSLREPYLRAEAFPRIVPDGLFPQLTERSRFTLCPRGFGATSFRLYEAMQLGSVPVYVSDCHHLPWADEIDWNEITVVVRPDEIPHLGARLRAIDEASYQRMLANIRRVCRQIERRVS